MERIRIIVQGAAGRVGQEVVKAVCQEPDMQLVGAVDIRVTLDPLSLPDGAGTVPFSTDFANAIDSCQPDVVVDFTVAKASLPAVRIAAKNGVNMVIGTTGFSAQDLDEMKKLAEANEVGIVAASNFALGAVLMIHLAKIAGKFMDHVEIIELHHDRKLDAPSGTSVSTARAMLSARGRSFLPPAVPRPGLMAHQEVFFGAPGQTLSIRHDTINRECYMPGVMLAVREVVKKPGFIYGLDTLLGL